MNEYHPDDRPSPSEQPIRARVPDHVSGGAFSTGVIVMTAHTEFILDFVQNLGRPHQIVARVVMPHSVLPQLVDALYRNMELYRGRWGELPTTPQPNPQPKEAPNSAWGVEYAGLTEDSSPVAPDSAQVVSTEEKTGSPSSGKADSQSGPPSETPSSPRDSQAGDAKQEAGQRKPPPRSPGTRQASAQEVYDDLKIKDELLSGAYANAVMIGHGAHEFSFDFITNFYPHSAVSSRIFLAAGQVPRLYDSLKGTWEQLRARMQPPPGDLPPDE